MLLPTGSPVAETADESERLRELGCDELQGFLYASPVAANAVVWGAAGKSARSA